MPSHLCLIQIFLAWHFYGTGWQKSIEVALQWNKNKPLATVARNLGRAGKHRCERSGFRWANTSPVSSSKSQQRLAQAKSSHQIFLQPKSSCEWRDEAAAHSYTDAMQSICTLVVHEDLALWSWLTTVTCLRLAWFQGFVLPLACSHYNWIDPFCNVSCVCAQEFTNFHLCSQNLSSQTAPKASSSVSYLQSEVNMFRACIHPEQWHGSWLHFWRGSLECTLLTG